MYSTHRCDDPPFIGVHLVEILERTGVPLRRHVQIRPALTCQPARINPHHRIITHVPHQVHIATGESDKVPIEKNAIRCDQFAPTEVHNPWQVPEVPNLPPKPERINSSRT